MGRVSKQSLDDVRLMIKTEGQSVAQKHAEREQQQGDGFEVMNVGDEIQKTLVDDKGSESPLGKQTECQPRDSAGERERRRSTTCAKAGAQAQEGWRKNECVETLPGDPEKGKIAQASANSSAQQSECDCLCPTGFVHDG